MNIEEAIEKGNIKVRSEKEFEDPGESKCKRCGDSYSPIGLYINYLEDYGYVGEDKGFCPVCIQSTDYEHTGKKECAECGSLYDPRYYMIELKKGIWSGEDLGKCLNCANPLEVKEKTYAISCSVCDNNIPHGEGKTVNYVHDSQRKRENVVVCSTECEDKITRSGY